jgi:hypothetical protein
VNQRMLDQILPTLDPKLSEEEEAAIRELATTMGEYEFFITGHDFTGQIFHLTFSDGTRQLTWALMEIVEHVEALRKGTPFPWEEELKRQGIHG